MPNRRSIESPYKRLQLKSCDQISELYNENKFTLFTQIVDDVCKILNCQVLIEFN